MIIELDGKHYTAQQGYYRERDYWMQEQQCQVLHFWNHDILRHLDNVLQQIRHALPQQR